MQQGAPALKVGASDVPNVLLVDCLQGIMSTPVVTHVTNWSRLLLKGGDLTLWQLCQVQDAIEQLEEERFAEASARCRRRNDLTFTSQMAMWPRNRSSGSFWLTS
ncbi:hypothetical protein RSO01_88040 [Reyranella soli]|uniref:Uncharacterized protein n=1 Tax=Reyranella soli TaxID=1230389 RepID=A0A512NRQ6_9HYPH|nr:hypothetical protein RSO01_88040 [Reyranella soli]